LQLKIACRIIETALTKPRPARRDFGSDILVAPLRDAVGIRRPALLIAVSNGLRLANKSD